jgi:hypothetical protein
MKTLITLAVLSAASFTLPCSLPAQEAAPDAGPVEGFQEAAEDLAADTREKADELAQQIDQSRQAHDVSAGLLQPIYALAERMSFPSFHWLAFTFMAAGVISYTLQLVLGKLVLLAKMSLNYKEILADALGLVISLIGLVLTTQAAAENSDFTDRPALVLSSAALGVLLGLIFYRWGQKEEVHAALGRKTQKKAD